MEGKPRAGVYLRISPKAVENKEVWAIERQQAACLELCERMGWEPTIVYKDEGVSASSRKARPAYEQLKRDMADGKIDAVAVWVMDRLMRKPAELEEFITLADARSIKLATYQGDIDLADPSGRLYARMMGVVAKHEMELKSKRQKAAAQQRADKGLPWGDRIAFGYTVDDENKMVPDPVTGPLVAELYHDLLAGASQRSLALRLNAGGHLTSQGNLWRQASLRSFLLAPRNAGLRTYLGQVVGKGNWEALVDEETFHIASAMIKANPNAGRARTGRYLLSGIPRCGVCKHTMQIARTSRDGKRIYQCYRDNCRKVGRDADKLEYYVTEYLLEGLATDPALAQRLIYNDSAPDYAARQDEIEHLRQRLDVMADQLADGDLTPREHKRATERLRQRISEAEAQLGRRQSSALMQGMEKDPRAFWAAIEGEPDRQRAIVKFCLDVEVLPTGRGRSFIPGDVALTWKDAA